MNDVWLSLAGEAITVLGGLAILVISTVGSFYIKKLMAYLEEKEIVETVARYVNWAEQAPAFQQWTGGDKFGLVLVSVATALEERGIDIDEQKLSVLIEDAVLKMKQAAAPILEN